jgi:hypothetical protein
MERAYCKLHVPNNVGQVVVKATPEAPATPSLNPLNAASIPLEIEAFVNYALYPCRRLTSAEDGTFGTQLCIDVRNGALRWRRSDALLKRTRGGCWSFTTAHTRSKQRNPHDSSVARPRPSRSCPHVNAEAPLPVSLTRNKPCFTLVGHLVRLHSRAPSVGSLHSVLPSVLAR